MPTSWSDEEKDRYTGFIFSITSKEERRFNWYTGDSSRYTSEGDYDAMIEDMKKGVPEAVARYTAWCKWKLKGSL
jgi:hypothetical protein